MKKIYLIGGYLINNNFGDVIQAKVWVDFYNKKTFKFTLVYYKEGEKALKKSFPNEQLIEYETFINKINNGDKDMLIHMYGGGYLNRNFGEVFNNVLKAASKNYIQTIVTGVQADKWFLNEYKLLDIKYRNDFIRWISFRDSKSKSLLNITDSIICDDSFGYFETRKLNKKIYQASNLLSNKILLQLSLNSYMYETNSISEVKSKLKNLIKDFKANSTIDLISSFKDTIGVLEGRALLEQLGIDIKNEITNSQAIDDKAFAFNGYKLAIVNSFHTFILATFKLNCPVYFISMSHYYDQKSQALTEYGLLDNEHTIRELSKLISLNKKSWQKIPNLDQSFDRMFKRFEDVKNKVCAKLLN